MATAMQENLLFEFYTSLGTNKVITWSNKTKRALTTMCVCVSLSLMTFSRPPLNRVYSSNMVRRYFKSEVKNQGLLEGE